MKFQALGSNYSGKDALKQLVAIGSSADSRQLTRKLEDRYGGHAYLFAKGRYALSEAIRMVREAKHDNIAINALTCSVVVEAVTEANATPLYVDVNPDTAHFSAEALNEALHSNQHVAAIVIQNTFGRMCDISSIEAVAREHNVFIIEDLAHSMGQTYSDGREAGTVGDIVMLTFGRDKLLDVVNGGALIVRNPRLHVAVRPPKDGPSLTAQLRDRIYPALTWLARTTYDYTIGRYILAGMYRFGLAVRSSDGGIHRNQSLPHWQARLVLGQLKDLSSKNAHRKHLMSQYESLLDNSFISDGGIIRAAVSVTDRTHTLSELRQNGFELADTWYDTPVGPARKYARLDYPSWACKHAVELSKTIINLPTHRYIREEDVQTMVKIVRQQ